MIHWSRYKLNKSGQPSRYAYDVLKAIIDVASADSERDSARALPFAAFLDGLSAPPKTSRPLAQGQQERQTEGGREQTCLVTVWTVVKSMNMKAFTAQFAENASRTHQRRLSGAGAAPLPPAVRAEPSISSCSLSDPMLASNRRA